MLHLLVFVSWNAHTFNRKSKPREHAGFFVF